MLKSYSHIQEINIEDFTCTGLSFMHILYKQLKFTSPKQGQGLLSSLSRMKKESVNWSKNDSLHINLPEKKAWQPAKFHREQPESQACLANRWPNWDSNPDSLSTLLTGAGVFPGLKVEPMAPQLASTSASWSCKETSRHQPQPPALSCLLLWQNATPSYRY